jgi:hypothetical protein
MSEFKKHARLVGANISGLEGWIANIVDAAIEGTYIACFGHLSPLSADTLHGTLDLLEQRYLRLRLPLSPFARSNAHRRKTTQNKNVL